jgi:DNA gyrase subunit A
MLALVDNQKQPKILSLRHILDEYIAFQEQIIIRRTQYDLRKAQERAHLLEGLLIAQDNIDEVIKIIRNSYNDAKENLMARFGLDEVQAQAICDMRLIALQGLNREKLEAEYKELEERIAYYNELLGSEEMLRGVLKEELQAIADKYGDDRLTEIQDVVDEIDIEDLIEEEDCCYTMSEAGYIKRMPVDTYRSQKRGGRGISAQSLKDEDYVKSLFIASTHDYLLFFTNRGRVHRRKGYQIPEASRTARGTAIVNILPLEQDEKVTAMVLTRTFDDNECLMMVTRNGTVKRLRLDAINTARKAGIRALTLDEGDELIAVLKTDGHQNILIATRNGMAICFDENDVRPMGRDAAGVRGIRLDDGDYVVGATLADTSKCLLTVTEKGYGKRTAVDEYLRGGENDDTRQPQKRGGKGLKNYNLTEKTGKVAGVCLVSDDQDVMLIADDGTIIRMAASDINTYSRVAQGVIVMRPDEGSHVIAVETTDREEEPTETGETTEA